VFWGYEGSPFCKIVREKLVDFEIPHIQKTCPRGSSKRSELFQKTGRFQVPYLEDPNTGVELFESADILDYLNDKYGLKY
jgi:glutathione S-transferase